MKRHGSSESSHSQAKKGRQDKPRVLKSGQMYFTKVNCLPDRFNTDSYSLSQILEEISPVHSIHFNFMIDVGWVVNQYPAACRRSPMTLVVGEKMGTDARSLKTEVSNRPQINVVGAKLPIPFGTHHTKLSIMENESKLHVIISTANLVPGDWGEKTQCFYYANATLPSTSADGSSSTPTTSLFQQDLLEYLQCYRLSELDYWMDRIRFSDFSGLSDRIIYSVPGYHQNGKEKFGHLALRAALTARGAPTPNPSSSRLFLAQCSSIGSLGPSMDSWMGPQFLKTLRGGKTGGGRMFLLYPSVSDVRNSIEGYGAGCSLPYQSQTADRQPWLKSILCKWRSEKRGRSRAMPHCKSYCELVDGVPQWLLVTSANMSKAAWGQLQKNCTQLMVRSYEMGVLITDPEKIQLPFDYPILKYSITDEPWIADKNYTEDDSLGEKWIVKR